MNKKIAFIFPGQGAQYPGMGRDFYKEFEAAKAVFDEADAILGRPFSQLIFNGPAEELTQTKNSQLAIFITSIAILRVIDLKPVVCSGLSLGEYSALVAAGKLSFKDALLLVEARGRLMQEACEKFPGTMVVVLGLEPDLIQEAIAPIGNVWIANLNCPGQVVIAGTKEGIEKATEVLKEKGARRVLPLEVSGAFHSGLMRSAQEGLQPYIEQLNLVETDVDIVMNVPGNYVSSIQEIRNNVVQQVTSPVYWQKGIEAQVKNGIDLFVEIGPGKTLAGMNKRIGVSVETLSIEKVEDIQHATIG
ncbi:MAG: ACP S-malonyltransferase [Verrucomicrobia bacterium]|nr:ACP S-malonyltransferase [Verrucomicrobiota bacterium]